MRHPTRNSLLGAALGILWAGSCLGQPEASPARLAYDECVNSSVAAQLLQLPFPQRKTADHNMMIETAFVACQTEERALGMLLSAMNPDRAPMLVMAVKIQVKRQILATIANPAAYLPAQ